MLHRGDRAAVVSVRAAALASIIILLQPNTVRAASYDDGCCADLEERIAELEATAARRGNRNVSLRLYGQVNRAVLAWDDGFEDNAYVIDNETSQSRFGLIGQARVSPRLTAGYRIEIELEDAASNEVTAKTDEGFADGPFEIRQSYWYIEDGALGALSVGQQSPATDEITIINLGSRMNDAALHYNNAFAIALDIDGALFTDLTWGHIAHTVDTLRGNYVRYDSPNLEGFVVSAAWGEDDVWDAAIRYAAAWNSFRFAAGVGYIDNRELDFRDVRGSGSLIHDPTGIYLSVAGGVRENDASIVSANDPAYFYYGQLGIRREWFSHGPTTVYADYGVYNDFRTGELMNVDLNTGQLVTWGTLTDTEARRWGFGIEQAFTSAELLVYAQAHFFDPRIEGFPCDNIVAGVCGGDPKNTTKLSAEAWQGFVVGSRIQF